MAGTCLEPEIDCGNFVKIFIGKDYLETTCVELAKHMYEADYHPDVLAGIWRGGAHAAAYATGALKRLGVRHVHFPVTGKSYSEGIGNRSHTIQIYNMEELTRYMSAFGRKRLCFFDDVIDSGVTAHALINVAQGGLRRRDAEKAFLIKNGEAEEIDPERAIRKGARGYALYNFPMRTDGTTYTIQAHMVRDIHPVEAEVGIVAPFEKTYANLTRVRPRVCEHDFEKVSGKPVWLNFPYETETDDITDIEMTMWRPNVARVLIGELAA